MMTAQEVGETVTRLKKEFRSMMNGVVSGSMREKGLDYGVNFGVEGVRLMELSRDLPHDAALARALWQERVRECRLLAPMTYPAEEFAQDVCEAWIDTLRTSEEAQYLAMHLLQHLSYAGEKVMEWMASENALRQLCGFLTAGRLLGGGVRFYGRERNELLDQCETAMYGKNPQVARAAYNALQRFGSQNSYQETEVEKIFSKFAEQKHP